jgi:Tat protein translocase TatB subunit
MDIFGIGFGELLFLIVIGVVIVGPEKLPGMAQKAGRAIAMVKAQTNEMKKMLPLDEITTGLSDIQQATDVRRLARVYDGKHHTPFDYIAPARVGVAGGTTASGAAAERVEGAQAEVQTAGLVAAVPAADVVAPVATID